MDHLLRTMKSFVELDERLIESRNKNTIEALEIQSIENNLIDKLVQISAELDDRSIIKKVQNLTNHLQHTQLLSELRPIVLSGKFCFSKIKLYSTLKMIRY